MNVSKTSTSSHYAPNDQQYLATLLRNLTYLCNISNEQPSIDNLIRHFGSVSKLLHTDAYELKRAGVSSPIYHQLFGILRDIFRYHQHEQLAELYPIQSVTALKNYALRIKYGMVIEELTVVFLNHQSQIISDPLHFVGNVDQVSINYLDILRAAICNRASFVALIHNHPAGEARPTKKDVVDTAKIAQQMSILDLHLIDHVIVNNDAVYSFRENNLL